MFISLERLKLLTFGSQSSSQRAYLHAVSRFGQEITTNSQGQVIDFETTKKSSLISLNQLSEVTFNKRSDYSLFLALNIKCRSVIGGDIEIWAEVNDGDGWVFVEDSGIEIRSGRGRFGYIQLKIDTEIKSGTRLRVKIRSTSDDSYLDAVQLSNGILGASAQLSISED